MVAAPTPRPPVVYVFPWIANAAREEGEEVPIPRTPDEVRVRRGIEDEAYASEEVPIMRVPPVFVNSQCLKFVAASVSVIANVGEVEARCRRYAPVVVPIATEVVPTPPRPSESPKIVRIGFPSSCAV